MLELSNERVFAMKIRITNHSNGYGLIAILFHWLMALLIPGLFALGWYMVDLSYYDSWYQTAPHWHKSIGILLLVFLVS